MDNEFDLSHLLRKMIWWNVYCYKQPVLFPLKIYSGLLLESPTTFD